MLGHQFQVSPVQTHDLAAQTEADTRSALFGGVEGEEYLFAYLFWDTWAVVAYQNVGRTVRFACDDVNAGIGLVLRCLARVPY